MISNEYIIELLRQETSEEYAKRMQGFFKTGKGQYGEGDIFWGIRVPFQRAIAKKVSRDFSPDQWPVLIEHPVHEVRLTALFILIHWYETAKSDKEKEKWVQLYIDYRYHINNWDLVDTSAYKILGDWFWDKDRSLLKDWVVSQNLWEVRIAVVSTYRFIKRGDFSSTLWMGQRLLNHSHDLIHKALGWMLREVGKMEEDVLLEFLNNYYTIMPRTMLRYAIEKLNEPLRKAYLLGEVKN